MSNTDAAEESRSIKIIGGGGDGGGRRCGGGGGGGSPAIVGMESEGLGVC